MEREQDGNRVVEEDDIRPPPHYAGDGSQQIVTADTARQGPLGGRVLIVLVGGLLLAAIVWPILNALVNRAP